ncbi:MAG: hypothetical protein CMG69_05370 [Candidatus Marinimicrobia bacterium]|nr:hypothetical protein [Candidatus Neomarinimicrobiota bacterium]|tara:strand:+ start:7229 stop:7666 length:438 start_codon:yes stop_codon:yes gene_type:complete
MNNTILTLIFIFSFFSCVEPPEHDYGLVENLPVVINTDNVFTYSLYGDKYTSEDTFDLQLLLSDSIHKVITSLIVSDFAGSNRDTTVITVEKDSTVVDVFSITSNYSSNPTETEVDSVFYLPKQVSVKLDQFSGKLEFLMIRSDL